MLPYTDIQYCIKSVVTNRTELCQVKQLRFSFYQSCAQKMVHCALPRLSYSQPAGKRTCSSVLSGNITAGTSFHFFPIPAILYNFVLWPSTSATILKGSLLGPKPGFVILKGRKVPVRCRNNFLEVKCPDGQINHLLLIYFQQDATLHSLLISGKLLYMFRVVSPPIIRSTYNCIYSVWYLSNRYCYLPHSDEVSG